MPEWMLKNGKEILKNLKKHPKLFLKVTKYL